MRRLLSTGPRPQEQRHKGRSRPRLLRDLGLLVRGVLPPGHLLLEVRRRLRPEEGVEEHVLGPHDAVDRLRRGGLQGDISLIMRAGRARRQFEGRRSSRREGEEAKRQNERALSGVLRMVQTGKDLGTGFGVHS